MFQKFRVIKSVDSEGRKVITYIKNTFETGAEQRTGKGQRGAEKLPEAVQVTVILP